MGKFKVEYSDDFLQTSCRDHGQDAYCMPPFLLKSREDASHDKTLTVNDACSCPFRRLCYPSFSQSTEKSKGLGRSLGEYFSREVRRREKTGKTGG